MIQSATEVFFVLTERFYDKKPSPLPFGGGLEDFSLAKGYFKTALTISSMVPGSTSSSS